MLAFEPPHFAPAVDGRRLVAAGLPGPRARLRRLGARFRARRAHRSTAAASDLRFGGQVMKNVAGYDVSRLLAGSLGTLGVHRRGLAQGAAAAAAEATLRFDSRRPRRSTAHECWAGKPLPLSATAWHDGRAASCACRGARRRGRRGDTRARRRGDRRRRRAPFWDGLREQTDPFFADAEEAIEPGRACGACRCRRPRRRSLWPATQLIEWNGALRWLATATAGGAGARRGRGGGGHATLFRGGDKSAGVFSPLAPPLLAIHERLKRTFDPAGIFNPGRLYRGL